MNYDDVLNENYYNVTTHSELDNLSVGNCLSPRRLGGEREERRASLACCGNR